MELKVDQVSKIYNNNHKALDNFSISFKKGVIGLLGPNGAGKSTLMRIIATISKPSTGELYWNDVNIKTEPDSLRSVLGYLPQDFGLYPNLNGEEFLNYIAALKGLSRSESKIRIRELLEFLNLLDVKKKSLNKYSGGMKQRIGIAQALLNDPEVLIVDEPTVGLDPQERLKFRNLLVDLASNRIVILSTHIVSDVESSASSLVLLNKGKLIVNETPEMLLKQLDGLTWEWIIKSEELQDVKKKYLTSNYVLRKDGLLIRAISRDKPHPDALPVNPSLEDAYFYYTIGNEVST